MFTDDGCDTYSNAEQYVMLGNFDRDLRFGDVRRIAGDFLESLKLTSEADLDRVFNEWLNVPENAMNWWEEARPTNPRPPAARKRRA